MTIPPANADAMELTRLDVLDALSGAVTLGQRVCVPASGVSMGAEFSLAHGIVIVPYNPATVSVGSVIAYQRDGRWIVHRVMGVYGQGEGACYITKGDVLAWLDRPMVHATAVKGVVVALNMANGMMVDLVSARWRWRGRARVMRGWITVAVTAVRSAARRVR